MNIQKSRVRNIKNQVIRTQNHFTILTGLHLLRFNQKHPQCGGSPFYLQ
jgi:hypothetical protein